MAFEVLMPRLGWAMESGILVEWHKNEGDFVRAGDILFSVEGDKAVQEVESLDSGVLRIPPGLPKPGDEAPVGALLAYLVPREELSTFVAGLAGGKQEPLEKVTEQRVVPGTTSAGPTIADEPTAERGVRISPRARRIATGLGVDWRAIGGTGPGGRITVQDVEGASRKAEPSRLAGPTGRAVPVAKEPRTTRL